MKKEKNKNIHKRIAAWVAIVLLALLYITALIVGIFAKHVPENLFAMCIFATVFVPLVAWIYIWLYGRLTGKDTIADFDRGATHISEEDK